LIVAQILPLIEGQVSDLRHQIWKIMPHMTWDNYFSGCPVFKFFGEVGFGATMTRCRDHLLKEIPDANLHQKKTESSPRPKAARFFNPINDVNKKSSGSGSADNKKGYQQVHSSFQSTSSCNISTVNALSACNKLI
jgi:hypothetical protein